MSDLFEIERLSIGLTGCRPGDVLVGTHLGTKDCVIKIHNKEIKPSTNILNRVRDSIPLLCKKLSNIPFFFSIPDKKTWLENNEEDNDYFPDDVLIEIIQPGTGDSVKKTGSILVAYLPEEVLSQTVSNRFISPFQINDLIIEYTGKTSTLFCLKTFWKISSGYVTVDRTNLLLIDVEEGKIYDGGDNDEENEIFILDGIAGSYEETKKGYEKKETVKVAFRVKRERSERKKVKDYFSNFSMAGYKSLLQKIIRFTPIKIKIGSTLYPSEEILEEVFLALLDHPGAFIPSIQRFTTGIESAPKRLAISILEDSSLEEKDYSDLLSLLSGAFLGQRVPHWRPSSSLLNKWVKIGIKAYKSPYINSVDYKKIREPHVPDKKSVLKTASAILDELRSFPTDLGLLRGWIEKIEKIRRKERPEVMPLYHLLDQHVNPDIAYLFPFDSIKKDSGSEPFNSLFKRIFFEVTGVNPRHPRSKYSKDFEQRPFVQTVRECQKIGMYIGDYVQTDRKESGGSFGLKYTIDQSWLAGLIGVVKVKVGYKNIIVTLKTDDILNFSVAKEPKARRGAIVYTPLTLEEEEEAIVLAKEKLRKGVPFDNNIIPSSIYYGWNAYLMTGDDGDYYVVGKNKSEAVPWSLARNLTFKFPLHNTLKRRLLSSLLFYKGDGAERNFYPKIEKVDRKISPRSFESSVYLSISS